MAPKRMTANPLRPARHRPGKPGAAVAQDSSDSDSEAEEQEEVPEQPKSRPAPAASSFPKSTSQISGGLKKVDINAEAERQKLEAEFETESEEESADESGSGSEEESEEEESSSEDEAAKRKLLRPVFMKKGARQNNNIVVEKSEDEKWAEEEAKRKQRTDAMVQEQLERQAQARAEGKSFWDDENIPDEIDDADGVDPEAELAAWKLRELKRVKRERDALIAAEKEREEIERRRNLTAEEREAEDREYLAAQKEERDGKGKMGFMQKYFHKGAYHVEGMEDRDIMGGRYVDDVQDRSALPEYMQIRDMTKLGKKGRTRYKDMKSEDTGRFGNNDLRRRPGRDDMDFRGVDDRFRPDFEREGGGPGVSGANASALGERKRPGDSEDPLRKRVRVD
jgi:microfibrillar-associated protein 1